MGPIDALELALSKEIEAIELYEKFSEQYREVKDVFLFLLNEEEKHRLLLEKKIVELKNK